MKNDNCKNCEWSDNGKPDSLSDGCDSCQSDPDCGWGGYTDHSDSRNGRLKKKSKSRKTEESDTDVNELIRDLFGGY